VLIFRAHFDLLGQIAHCSRISGKKERKTVAKRVKIIRKRVKDATTSKVKCHKAKQGNAKATKMAQQQYANGNAKWQRGKWEGGKGSKPSVDPQNQ